MLQRAYVEITNVCNLRCSFCPGTKREKKFIDPAEFRVLAEKLRLWTDYGGRPEAQFFYGLRQQSAVLCDGTVVPCCLDGEGRLALGNLLVQGLDEIWDSPRARAIREGFDRRRPSEALCRRCGFARRCRR